MESMVKMTKQANKKILITGNNGFKGSWLSLWLSKLGSKVYGISLPPKKITLYF